MWYLAIGVITGDGTIPMILRNNHIIYLLDVAYPCFIQTGLGLYRCNHILTHWGRVTHICVSKLTIIGSDNGLSPGRRQAIVWTNAGILLIQALGTKVSEILSQIQAFSFK